jgi:hypothetical protein
MKITAIRLENFHSLNEEISSVLLDPNDLTTIIGIKDRNCHHVFDAIIFVSDILLSSYRDDTSFIRSNFKNSDITKPIKIVLD